MEVGESSNDSVELPLETANESQLPLELQSKYNQSAAYTNGSAYMNGDIDEYQPRVIITEQPQQRGFRFRYECEGPSHGGLQGEKSERSRKTFPSIKVENYQGPARVVVSLVTDEPIPKHHAHKLVGKNCQNGICVMEVKCANSVISFPNLCVLHVTRKKAAEVLQERILESLILDKKVKLNNIIAEIKLTKEDREKAKKEAQEQAKNMSLNVVRLCFQVYLLDEKGEYNKLLQSQVSRPIYDSKSPGASALKICRMDKYGGCCTGNEEVFLLCEKVQKDDIQVRFVEQNKDGSVKWEAYGNFGPLDVHRQYAIVFRTPPYRDTQIEKAVNVMIMLQRKADCEVSEPKAFTYYPQNLDKDGIARKKRKTIPLDGTFPSFFSGGFGGTGGGGFGFGGPGGSGGGGQQQYRVILPNGNVVQQQGNVPATVEQAISEVYASPSSPYHPSSVYDDIYSDLDMDCEPFTSSTKIATHNIHEPSDIKKPGHSAKLNAKSKSVDVGKTAELIKSMKLDSSSECGVNKAEKQASECKKDDTPVKSDASAPSENVSEGTKTDEGFSETSETSSVRGDMSPKKSKLVTETSCPAERSLKPQKKGEAIRIARRTAMAMKEYAETGDVRHILLVQRHLASVQNENGDLPLHLAVINNQVIALQCLLDVMATLPNAHSRVNCFNYLRQTPLHLAVLTQQQNVIELLLHAGADPSLSDRNGNTPAHLAVLCGTHNCLKSLVKYLIPGVRGDKPFPELDYLNYDGYTPTHLAASRGDCEMLRTLVYGKADINLPDGKSGRTALHHAVEVDDLPTAGYLLMETETDVNARCFDGNTALHFACGRGLVGMVALLMTAGADPSIENEEIPSDQDQEEGEGDEISGDSWDRRGMRPIDYAQENERILRVLQGQIFQSNSDDDLQEDSSSTDPIELTHLTSLSIKSHNESGLGSMNIKLYQEGDLERLSFLTRIDLSKLLDPRNPGKDVFALAEKLGYHNLQNALEGMQETSSPTRFLLDYYEASDGTVAKLKVTLLDMNRQDAAAIIDNAVSGEVKGKHKPSTDPARMDSGVHSFGGKMPHATSTT